MDLARLEVADDSGFRDSALDKGPAPQSRAHAYARGVRLTRRDRVPLRGVGSDG